MKLYQISTPGDFPALVELEKNGQPVTQIVIGEPGRGREQAIIPVTGEGPEVRARRTDKGIVLVRGHWPHDDRCLLLVNAVGGYDRKRSYRVYNQLGIRSLMAGKKAFGAAGRTNFGEEILTIVQPGAEFLLHSKYASHWYMWDASEWSMERPEERNARLALQEVEQGGGEWI